MGQAQIQRAAHADKWIMTFGDSEHHTTCATVSGNTTVDSKLWFEQLCGRNAPLLCNKLTTPFSASVRLHERGGAAEKVPERMTCIHAGAVMPVDTTNPG